MIVSIVSAVLLFALSAWCKAAMDTRGFLVPAIAYKSYPNWFREWMQRRGKIPIVKIDDGWHSMQALMFLCLGVAFLLCGIQWSEIGMWVFASIPLRTVVHGIVFEALYPMR